MEATTTPRLSYREMRTRAQKIADETIKEHVLNGIELLNREYGPGWVDHIDPNELILANASCCVLGQLYGDYDEGAEILFGEKEDYSEKAEQHGFYSERNQYSILDRAWQLVVG